MNPKFNAKFQRQQGYGMRRQYSHRVKQEDNFHPGDPGLPILNTSASSSTCLPPPPPPPPMRQRTVAAWGAPVADANGYGGSNYRVQHFGTEDEPMHSQNSWNEPYSQNYWKEPQSRTSWKEPWNVEPLPRALPPPASNSLPQQQARYGSYWGTGVKEEMHEERESFHNNYKLERESSTLQNKCNTERESPGFQNKHNPGLPVKQEKYRKIKRDLGSDDDSEDDFRMRNRSYPGKPNGHGAGSNGKC
jgi:hypothetical protein